MGLLVRIHYYHEGCVELMEKMENLKRITRNPLHVLEIVNRGLIISNPKRFSFKFTKCHLIVHALGSWMTILKSDGLVTHRWILFMRVMLLLGFFPRLKVNLIFTYKKFFNYYFGHPMFQNNGTLIPSLLDSRPWSKHPLETHYKPNEHNGTIQLWTSKANHIWSNLSWPGVWLFSRMMIGLPDIALGNNAAKQAFWRWESISMPLPFHPLEHPPKDNGIGPSFTLIEGSNHNISTNLKL